MPQGYPLPIPNPLFKENGDGAMVPAVGYEIHTFEIESVTPKDTYSDAELSSLNTNPIIVDADGRYRAYVAAGETIKAVIKTEAAVSVETFDNLLPMVDPEAPDSPGTVPTGVVVWSPYSTTPSGYLPCDGSAVSRATYADLNTLAAADSYPNGSGNGTTTFNLPDLRGRAPYGLATSGTGSTLGTAFGSMDHTHTGPSHTHDTTVPRDGWGHTNNVPATSGRIRTGDAAGTGTEASAEQATADQVVTSAAGGTGNTGTGNPPGVPGYWYIKT